MRWSIIMTYKGHIKNGMVVLDEPLRLPEGSQVLIQPVAAVASVATPLPLSDLLRQVAGRGKDLPADGSAQHDHYTYGTPKR